MTTCPSGVNYMHLARPGAGEDREGLPEAAFRTAVPRRARLDPAAARPAARRHDAGRLGRPLAALLPGSRGGFGKSDFIAPDQGDAGPFAGRPAAARTGRRQRLCGQGRKARGGRLAAGLRPAGAAPRINQAAINVLTRHGIEVVLVKDERCCGALTPPSRTRRRRAGAGARQHHRLARRGGEERPRCHPGDDVGLRHRDQGLRLYAARGPRLRRSRGKDIGAGQGHHRISRQYILGPTQQHGDIVIAYHSACFAPARAENHACSERIAFQERIRGERCARESFVLRFGGDLQHSPA